MTVYQKGPQNVNSIVCMVLVSTAWIAIYVLLLLSSLAIVSWLQYMYFFSYVRLAVTLVKYIPQAFVNWRRQSTVGWSISQIFLDVTGSVFSIAQTFVDSINTSTVAGTAMRTTPT